MNALRTIGMPSVPNAYPTPQRVNAPTQPTSVEVAAPLLCPPTFGTCVSVLFPTLSKVFLLGGIGRFGLFASPPSLFL